MGNGLPSGLPPLDVVSHPEQASASARIDARRVQAHRRRISLTRILATPEDVHYRHTRAYWADVTIPAIVSGDRRKRMELDATAMRDTERRRLRALVQVDMDTADTLHADDYQLITPRGYAMSKREYLDRIASGRLRYRVFEPVSDIAVRGSDEIALLRYQARISVTENDGETGDDADAGSAAGRAPITCWHTDCYEWRDARWQAVWSQATVIRPE